MKVLAVIPARGGSKGIPKKNLQLINGTTLIERTIIQAKASKYIERVVVSTDDPEIKRVASASGAAIVHRPNDLSSDNSPSEYALLHTLECLKENEGYQPDILVMLQCTSPFLLAEDIDTTVSLLINARADTAFTASIFTSFLWKYENNNAVGINHEKSKRVMRQEFGKQFLETGSVYVMRIDGFLKSKHRFFGKTIMHIIPKKRAMEIDDPEDLLIVARTLV